MINLTIFESYYIDGWLQASLSKYSIKRKALVWVGFVGTFCNNLRLVGLLQGLATYSTVQSIQGLFLCRTNLCWRKKLTAGHKGLTEYCGAREFGNVAERQAILNDYTESELPSWVTVNNPITQCETRLRKASQHSKRVSSRRSDLKSRLSGLTMLNTLCSTLTKRQLTWITTIRKSKNCHQSAMMNGKRIKSPNSNANTLRK
jgi:hypothetical protein